MATSSGSVAAEASINRMALRRGDTSVRDNDVSAIATPPIPSPSSTSGSCSANSVGKYDHGMSGTETSAPSNISFHGFSKNCEKYVSARNGLAGSMIDHGQINAMTR